MTISKSTITKLLILTIVFTFALSVNYLFAAWTGPTQAPPGGNTPTPVHVGSTEQLKDGALSLGALAVFGNGWFQGNVGVGVVTPLAKLHIGGTPAVDGIMFPDGTLQTTASGGGGIPSGAVMYFNLASCPSGWSKLTNAQGRLLVGLSSGGTLGGTVGTPYADLEDRAHNHGLYPDSCPNVWAPSTYTCQQKPSKTKNNTAGIPYVQFLICQKN